jgi:hypothetical protein
MDLELRFQRLGGGIRSMGLEVSVPLPSVPSVVVVVIWCWIQARGR